MSARLPDSVAPAASSGDTRAPRAARIFLALGGVDAALAVALGAAGAHAWKARLAADDPGGLFALALHYHQFHALGLILVGLALARWPRSRALLAAGGLMLAGTLLFSGSLYLRSLFGLGALPAAVPLGGFAFITGWLCLAAGALTLER